MNSPHQPARNTDLTWRMAHMSRLRRSHCNAAMDWDQAQEQEALLFEMRLKRKNRVGADGPRGLAPDGAGRRPRSKSAIARFFACLSELPEPVLRGIMQGCRLDDLELSVERGLVLRDFLEPL